MEILTIQDPLQVIIGVSYTVSLAGLFSALLSPNKNFISQNDVNKRTACKRRRKDCAKFSGLLMLLTVALHIVTNQ
jgi:hypothetical protein